MATSPSPLSFDSEPNITMATSFDFVPYDKIQVYFLEATLGPLTKLIKSIPGSMVDDSIVSINGFHTGIGFISGKVAFTIALEIESDNMVSAVIPKIIDNKVVWDGCGNVIKLGEFDPTYWDQSTYLCDISRKQFMKLKDSIFVKDGFVNANPYYSLFKVINDISIPSPVPLKSYPKGSIMNPLIKSSDCDDFAYFMIDRLQTMLNVKLNFATRPNYSSAGLVTNATPIKLDDDDPKILAFYSGMHQRILSAINQLTSICQTQQQPQPQNPTQMPVTTLISNEIDAALENMLTACGLKIYAGIKMNDPSIGYKLFNALVADAVDWSMIIYHGYDENNMQAYYEFPLRLQSGATITTKKGTSVPVYVQSPISIKYFKYPLLQSYDIVAPYKLLSMKAKRFNSKKILPIIISVLMVVFIILIIIRLYNLMM